MTGAGTGAPGDLDKVQFAIERLLDAPDGWRVLVRDMVGRWPEAPAGELILAIVTAAAEIEATFGPGSPARDGAGRGWRLAGLLGVDLYAMQAAGLPHGRAGDLPGYWTIDPYFRDL
jgi:ABC-type sugar transport system substrate-binding protein